ncbi:type II toxin-antitoxin system RelE family toxin [Geoglobus acetivorans]
MRIGGFRVVYFIDKENRTIHILWLERRGRIY